MSLNTATSATTNASTLMCCPPCRLDLFGLDVRSLDDRPPLLDLGLVIGGEAFRRLLLARRQLLALLGEALLHGGIGERSHDRGVELGDDVLGRAFGRPHPVPQRDRQPRHPHLLGGRHLGRREPARLGHHGNRPDAAGAPRWRAKRAASAATLWCARRTLALNRARRRAPRWRAKRAASAATLWCARRTLALNRARRRAPRWRAKRAASAATLWCARRTLALN